MVLRKKSEYVIMLLEREAEIFEAVRIREACSSLQVYEMLGRSNLLETMRIIHAMEAKGLLERTVVDGRKLFRIKANYKVKVIRRESNKLSLPVFK